MKTLKKIYTQLNVMRSLDSLVALLIVALCSVYSSAAAQAVPTYWPYQGVLSDQTGQAINTPVNLSVSIYRDAFDATALWRGDLSAVPVNNGSFAVDLGEVGGVELSNILLSGEARYIGISVNGGPELSPRSRIGAVPYATLSQRALNFGELSPADVVTHEALEQALPNLDNLNAEIAAVRGIAEGAQGTADQASAAAQTAQGTADQANTAAQTAQEAAGQAQAAAQTAQVTADAALTEAEAQDLINQIIGDQGYLTADQINALVEGLIDNRGYLSADAINTLINQLIDARGYVTAAQAQAVADERVAAAETRLNEAMNLLLQRIQDLENDNTADQALAAAQAAQTTANQAVNAAQAAQTTADQALAAAQAAQGTGDQAVNAAQAASDEAGDALTAAQAAQATADQALALAQGGGQAHILGVSGHSDQGFFRFTDSNGVQHQGVRAAGETCKATYANEPTAHFCSTSEAQEALSTGSFNANINNVETWLFPSWSKNDGGFAGDADFCQSLLYNSADAARGTTLRILTAASSTRGGVGVRFAFNDTRACNTSLPVLCCR